MCRLLHFLKVWASLYWGQDRRTATAYECLNPNENFMAIKEAGKGDSQAQRHETDDEAAGALANVRSSMVAKSPPTKRAAIAQKLIMSLRK